MLALRLSAYYIDGNRAVNARSFAKEFAVDKTTLNFLSDEGAVAVTFVPALTPDQYNALYTLMKQRWRGDDLKELLKRFAKEWNVTLRMESH